MGNSNTKEIDVKDTSLKNFIIEYINKMHKEIGKEIFVSKLSDSDLNSYTEIGKIIAKKFNRINKNEYELDFCYSLVVTCYESACSYHHKKLKFDNLFKIISEEDIKIDVFDLNNEKEDSKLKSDEPDWWNNHGYLKLHRLFCEGIVINEGAYGFDDGGLTCFQ
jgi:hypothetical protein